MTFILDSTQIGRVTKVIFHSLIHKDCDRVYCILGKFKVSIARVWYNGKTKRDGEQDICGAHASTMSHRAASYGTLLQLEEGDELYAKGHSGPSGSLYAGSSIRHSSFEAYLLYKATPWTHKLLADIYT